MTRYFFNCYLHCNVNNIWDMLILTVDSLPYCLLEAALVLRHAAGLCQLLLCQLARFWNREKYVKIFHWRCKNICIRSFYFESFQQKWKLCIKMNARLKIQFLILRKVFLKIIVIAIIDKRKPILSVLFAHELSSHSSDQN